jgi:histidinol-phosphate aminotransferase
MQKASLEIYPEPEGFIQALSGYVGYPPEEIIIGAGMDGVIDTISRLFLGPGDRSAIPIPTFSYYEIVTTLSGASPLFLPMGSDFKVPKMPKEARMIFLCSPNNPTGNSVSEDQVREIAETAEGIVFLDEAYVEFADKSLVHLVRRYENLVVGRTMSKAFGLAGMRLGYAVAPEWIAQEYRRAAPPFFGVATASLAAGLAALEDLEHMRSTVARIQAERERLLKAIPGACPSQGNFLYLETSLPSGRVAEKMLRQGVIIRDCASFRGAGDHHIRVTVGTPEQNQKFLEGYLGTCS